MTVPFQTPVVTVPMLAREVSAVTVVETSVESAFGSVNVFSVVAGPVNLVKPLPVPPKVDAMTCASAALPSKLLP